jgi:CRISPR-associated protein Cas2
MQKLRFLIAYDIKNKKRLVKIARMLEKRGVRIEYSVFYMEATKEEMSEFAISLASKINTQEDDIRIYIIEENEIALGNALVLDEIFILK